MKPDDISSIGRDYKLSIPSFSKDSVTSRTSAQIQKKYGGAVPKTPPNIDEIIDNAIRFFRDQTSEELPEKDLRHLCYACLRPQIDNVFIKNLTTLLKKNGNKRHYSALMTAYVMNFSTNDERCHKLAETLHENRGNLSRAWQRRLGFVDLLDIDNIERMLAEKVLAAGSEKQTFEQIGLIGAYQGSNLVTSVLIVSAQIISRQIANDNFDNFDNFINLITENGKIKPTSGQAALVGLLLPFFEKTPSSSLKNRLKELFVSSYSDPRIVSHSWPEIPAKFGGTASRKKCLDIIKKWLNFDSIELFFKIIAEHAPDEQFEPRRALWQSYFDQEHVTDAWAILGPAASKTADSLKKSDKDAIGLRWSKLKGARSDQSVLLMKIGDLVVAEWSHSGKFRAWDEISPQKPKFYRTEYTGLELRRNSNSIRTSSGSDSDGITHNGNWVPRAQQYINQQTGIRLSRKIR